MSIYFSCRVGISSPYGGSITSKDLYNMPPTQWYYAWERTDTEKLHKMHVLSVAHKLRTLDKIDRLVAASCNRLNPSLAINFFWFSLKIESNRIETNWAGNWVHYPAHGGWVLVFVQLSGRPSHEVRVCISRPSRRWVMGQLVLLSTAGCAICNSCFFMISRNLPKAIDDTHRNINDCRNTIVCTTELLCYEFTRFRIGWTWGINYKSREILDWCRNFGLHESCRHVDFLTTYIYIYMIERLKTSLACGLYLF